MYSIRSYLLEITNRVPNQRAFQELIDVLACYRYNELLVYRATELTLEDQELGDPVNWNRLAAYCQMQGLEFRRLDKVEWERLLLSGTSVFAPTCAARSLAGRAEEMRELMIRADGLGRERHAERFLVTDFSDGYEWHPLIVSLPAIVMGGNFASSGPKSANMDLERELNRVLNAPLAGYLLKLGTLYLRGGAMREGESEYFNILAGDCGYSRHAGLTQMVLDEVSGIAHGVRIATERWFDRSDWAQDIAYAAGLLDAACHRRSEPILRMIRDEHGRMWRARFAPLGRVASLARLPRF